jgi:hypothetical protein
LAAISRVTNFKKTVEREYHAHVYVGTEEIPLPERKTEEGAIKEVEKFFNFKDKAP